jgi:hypothetical protein
MRIDEPTVNRLHKTVDRAEHELAEIRNELSSDIDLETLRRRIREIERHTETMRAIVGIQKEDG